MNRQRGVTLLLMIIFIVAVVCLIGWAVNIYKLVKCDFAPPYRCEVIRSVGLIPPIGAVVGYIDIEDNPNKENAKND